jgi:hypothetical protein
MSFIRESSDFLQLSLRSSSGAQQWSFFGGFASRFLRQLLGFSLSMRPRAYRCGE